jgi:hypothetical protein
MRAILALMTRALTEESRLNRTYLMRGALPAVVLLLLVSAHRSFARVGAAGRDMFLFVVLTNAVFLSLAAVTHLSSAIAEEKEEETLGLLRMTRLNPLSILLGKGISRGMGLGMLVLLQVPFTLLTITLGGVSFVQVAAAYSTLLAYVVFLTGLGLLCSVVMGRTSTAATLMSLLLGMYLLGPLVGEVISRMMQGMSRRALSFIFESAFYLTPFGRLLRISESRFAGPALDGFVGLSAGLGALFFLIAWVEFDRFTREQKSAAPSRGLLVRAPRRFKWLSPGTAWRDGLAWKDFNFITGGWPMLIVRMFAFALLAFVLMMLWVMGLRLRAISAEAAMWVLIVVIVALALEPCIILARKIPRVRKQGQVLARLPFYTVALLAGTAWWIQEMLNLGHRVTNLTSLYLSAFAIVLGLDLALAASRLFGAEVLWRTWPSVFLLPSTLGRVVRRKAAGVLLGLTPALLFWAGVTGLMFIGHPRERVEATCGMFGLFVEGVLIAHIIALVSLYAKHGAILIGAMLYLFFLVFLPVMLDWRILPLFGWIEHSSVGEYLTGLFIRAAMIVSLQVFIMKRLRRLAAA